MKVKINEALVNILAPTDIKFNKNDFEIGENYGKVFAITKYPQTLRPGFYNNISNIKNTIVNYHFTPLSQALLMEAINKLSKQQIQIENSSNDLLTQKTAQITQESIVSIMEMASKNNEVMGQVFVTIMSYDKNKEEFERTNRKVEGTIAGESCMSRAFPNIQKEFYQSISPTYPTNKKTFDMCSKVMPLSTFIGGFPFSSVGFNDGNGFVLGRDTNNSLVICDIWKRGNDRINSNIVVTGKPGSGKSTAIKHIILKEYEKGTKIIIIDPEREYKDMCENLKGDWINLVGGKNMINPFNFNITPKDADDDTEVDNIGLPDLAKHIEQLCTFLLLYDNSLAGAKITYLKKVINKLYNKFNINYETKASDLSPEQYPTFTDLDNYLNEKLKLAEGNEKNTIQEIMNSLYDITYGGDQFLWNGHTNINVNSNCIVFDTKDLQESGENKKRAEYYNVITYIWNLIEKDRKEKVLFVCDESYLLVDINVPQTLIFLRNVSKRIRKYEGGLVLITHDVEDFLNPTIKMYGQSLLNTACYVILFGTDGKNLEEETELFNLTEKENELLYGQRRGHCLFIAGTKKIHLQFVISNEELAFMGKAGGR